MSFLWFSINVEIKQIQLNFGISNLDISNTMGMPKQDGGSIYILCTFSPHYLETLDTLMCFLDPIELDITRLIVFPK